MTRRFALATYRSLDQINANLREHEEIFAALLARDPETAASLMTRHLQRSASNLVGNFGKAEKAGAR